jgi:hypothetical protein
MDVSGQIRAWSLDFEGKTVSGSHRVGGCSGCDVVGGACEKGETLSAGNGTPILLVVEHIAVTASAIPVSVLFQFGLK